MYYFWIWSWNSHTFLLQVFSSWGMFSLEGDLFELGLKVCLVFFQKPIQILFLCPCSFKLGPFMCLIVVWCVASCPSSWPCSQPCCHCWLHLSCEAHAVGLTLTLGASSFCWDWSTDLWGGGEGRKKDDVFFFVWFWFWKGYKKT